MPSYILLRSHISTISDINQRLSTVNLCLLYDVWCCVEIKLEKTFLAFLKELSFEITFLPAFNKEMSPQFFIYFFY